VVTDALAVIVAFKIVDPIAIVAIVSGGDFAVVVVIATIVIFIAVDDVAVADDIKAFGIVAALVAREAPFIIVTIVFEAEWIEPYRFPRAMV
jgi:hypothetical protein